MALQQGLSFGALLKRYRRMAHLTQEDLAERAGYTPNYLSMLERGVRPASPVAIDVLAAALELDASASQSLHGSARPMSSAPPAPSYPLSVADPCIGRDEILGAMFALLPDRAGPDSPRLLLLSGEQGVGKTRLLAELSRYVREMGVQFLAGGCYEQEGHLPYGAIHDALLDWARTQPETELRDLLQGPGRELVRILPELEPLAPAGPGDGQRLRLFSGVARLLQAICQVGPLVLALDDIHWADEGTLQLLHFLVRQPALDRILLVATHRPEETGVDAVLASFERTVRITVEPLGQTAFASLLSSRLTSPCHPDLVAALYERSEGNPFFGLQIVQLLEQEERLVLGSDGWQLKFPAPVDLPPEVRETVMRRLRRAGPEARKLLMLGAVLGREFEHRAIDALWDGDPESLFASLEASMQARVLVETDRGYIFHHPLLREVAYQRMPVQLRRWLHVRTGLALEVLYGESASAHATELSWHFLQGGDTRRTLHYSLLAGDRAESGLAHEMAETHYRSALHLARELGDRPRVALACTKLGTLLRRTGHYLEALQMLDEGAAIYADLDDLNAVARATAEIARANFFRATYQEGIDRVQAILPAFGNRPSPEAALLYLSLARLLAPVRRYVEESAAADRAVAIAREMRDMTLLGQALETQGRALLMLGCREQSAAVLEESVAAAEIARDWECASAASNCLAYVYLVLGDLEKAEDRLLQALNAADRAANPYAVAGARFWLGNLFLLRGERPRARRSFEEAQAIVETLGLSSLSAYPPFGRGMFAVMEGDCEAARNPLEAAATLAQRTDNHWVLLRTQAALASIDLAQCDVEGAASRLAPWTQRDLDEEDDLVLALALTGIDLAAGRVGEALSDATEVVERADAAHLLFLLTDALLVLGAALEAANRAPEAASCASRALALSRRLPYPYAEGRALGMLGKMHSSSRGAP